MKALHVLVYLLVLLFFSCTKIVVVEDISATKMIKANTSKEKDSHLILDLRSRELYQKGHLDFAINIPKEELSQRIDEIIDLKSRPIYIYARNADESFEAAQTLVNAGFETIFNVEGTEEYHYELVKFNTIRVFDIRHGVNSGNYFLIDYRTKSSYQQEHFKGAVNIPVGEIEPNLHLLPRDKNRPIVVYCNTGITSMWGAKELMDMGYTNVSVVLEGANSDIFVREMDLENVKED